MTTPVPAISAMTGTYRKISFFTPVRDVNVVQPVKFRAEVRNHRRYDEECSCCSCRIRPARQGGICAER